MKWFSVQFVHESILLGVLAFGPLAFGAVEPWSVAIQQCLVFSLLAIKPPSLVESNEIHHALLPATAAIVAIGVIQAFSPSPLGHPNGWFPTTAGLSDTCRALVLWWSYVVFLACVPSILKGKGMIFRVESLFVVLGIVIAVIGVVQRGFFDGTMIYGLRKVTNGALPFGPYYNPNHAASVMSMSLIIGLGLFAARFIRRGMIDFHDSAFLAQQFLFLFFLVVIFLGILKTASRGALVVSVIGGMLVSFFASQFISGRLVRNSIKTAVLLAVGVVFAIIGSNRAAHRFAISQVENGVAYRSALYGSGMLMVKDFPFTGVGLGALKASYPAYQSEIVRGVVEHIHSDWLELLIEVGAFGFGVYVFGLVCVLRSAIKGSSALNSNADRVSTFAALLAALAFIVHGLIEFSFHIPANSILFLAVLCISLSRQSIVASPSARSDHWRLLPTMVAVFSMILAVTSAIASAFSN